MAKMPVTLKDLARIPGVEVLDKKLFVQIREITTDSRKLEGKDCFVALKGEKFDGHEFVPAAISAGVKTVIVNKSFVPSGNEKIAIVKVPDTTLFLGTLANIKRKKFKGVVIGITGSNGKTSTKDILTTILSEKFKVHSTGANNNNHIGVPLTIFELDNSHRAAVIEMGTNHFGEIEYLAKTASPDIGVITNIGPSHLEFLKNLKGVFKEKSALFKEVIENKGTLIVNKDDEFLKKYSKKYKRPVSFGSKKSADVNYAAGKVNPDGTQDIVLTTSEFKIKTASPLIGGHNASNIAAATAVAVKLGMKKNEIKAGISKLTPPKHRLNFIRSGNAVIIDDTYNSNPNSVRAALKVLKMVAGDSEKVIALGDMFELGETAEKEHRALAQPVLKSDPAITVLIGSHMEFLYDELNGKIKNLRHFSGREQFAEFIRSLSERNMFILFKGSRGMKMEEFINQLTEVRPV